MSSSSYFTTHDYYNPSSSPLRRSKSPSSIRLGGPFYRDSADRLLDLVQLRSDLLDQREGELKSRHLIDGENVALRRYNRALEEEILDLENENRRLGRGMMMNEIDSRSTVASSSYSTTYGGILDGKSSSFSRSPPKTTSFAPPSPPSQSSSLFRLDSEVEKLRQSVKALANKNASLRRQQLQSNADCSPNSAPLDTVSWRIVGMTRKLRSMRSTESVMSPLLGSAILGLHDVEFDFFPNGAGGCPQRGCTVVLRCDKRLTITFQLFVGGKRSLPITHTFTGIGGYRHDFKRIRDELELDDTVSIGVDILEVRCPCCCYSKTTTCNYHCHHHRNM